jgi:alpha-D-ribose 1-methylphosphonate 5-triphosphate synthase subunit PhnL
MTFLPTPHDPMPVSSSHTPAPAPELLLDAHGLTKQFHIHHLERHIPAFEPVSFTLRAGEFLLISGPNGAGKSSLLRCLYRTYLPSGGSARYHSLRGPIDLATAADADIALLRREEIGFVTQFLRARPRVSALEWVAEGASIGAAGWGGAHAAAEHLLGSFGVKPALWHAYPTTFSGGEQQKVNLARALAGARRLLLLDEPTASLDVGARAALRDKIAMLKADGVALIGIFHHPEEVADLVDGEIELRGTYVAE